MQKSANLAIEGPARRSPSSPSWGHAWSRILPFILLPRRIRARHLVLAVCAVVFALLVLLFANIEASESVRIWSLSVPVFTIAAISLRRIGLSRWTIAIILVGVAAYLVYFGYTRYTERNLDAKEQVAYITYLAKYGRVPNADHCFVCHHPPLYYAAAAACHKLSSWTGVLSPMRGVQLLAVTCNFAFLIFFSLIARRLTHKTWVIASGTALVALWPYMFIHSSRVHNDVLAAPLMAGCMYFLVCWYQDRSFFQLLLSVVFSILAVTTKMNGFAMVGAIGATAFYQWVAGPDRRRTLLQAGPLLLATLIGLGTYTAIRAERSKADETLVTERVFGSAYRIGKSSWVHNEPENFLYFDLKSFVHEPYLLARHDGSGRQYYLNHLLKSSLFSTHNHIPDKETSYRLNSRIAGCMNFLLLAMLAFTGSVLVRAKRGSLRPYIPLIISTSCLLGAGVAFRMVVPHSHHSDFRHVFPLLIPGCLAFVLGIAWYREQRSLLEYVGHGIIVTFVALSAAYFAPKYDLMMRLLPPQYVEMEASDLKTRVKEGRKWNARGHVVLDGNDVLRVLLPEPQNVARLEVALDHNDSYWITVVGADEQQVRFSVGPTSRKKGGMVHYDQALETPVPNAVEVLVQPIKGDRLFSVGHVIAHRSKEAPAATGSKSRARKKKSTREKPTKPD